MLVIYIKNKTKQPFSGYIEYGDKLQFIYNSCLLHLVPYIRVNLNIILAKCLHNDI